MYVYVCVFVYVYASVCLLIVAFKWMSFRERCSAAAKWETFEIRWIESGVKLIREKEIASCPVLIASGFTASSSSTHQWGLLTVDWLLETDLHLL